ncbi:MAG: hypothetical protein E6I81_01090 [Chloroflexi bacterium]|nr:MAG: hypothetical protein E6I89_02240 [Chloroflexota bacterium]TMD74343.1 MAG: hypothetical protein E6I81_01090 [Chloroflexota bacterium]
MPFDVEDLARASLVRILPRSRYRLAAQTDARFQSFAGNTTRIAYRQQGATPAFLLFSGPGQNPHAAAMAAATWAEANWRPNAIQRRVRPGVVVVHVAPGNQLTQPGTVEGAGVPASIWTVDSDTGRVGVAGTPPGSPSAGDVKRAAADLLKGATVPSLGELDLAERNVMQVRTVGVPRIVGGAVSLCLILVALRFGLGGVVSLFALPGAIASGNMAAVGSLAVSVLILAGIILGIGVLLNIGNLAFRVPGFSSPVSQTRNLAWGAYVAVMVGLVLAQGAMPGVQNPANVGAGQTQYVHVTATTSDDGSETFVNTGGDLTVDLSGWPSTEWPGVQFKTSNPSVLSLDVLPGSDGSPVAKFTAHQAGVSRVDAASADGRYTFQLRVYVGAAP